MDIITINGAKAIGMENSLGSVEVGKYADLVVIDGKAPNLRPLLPENMVANLAYSMCNANVKTVMCQGDIVVDNRIVQTLDCEDILRRSEDAWRSLCLR